MNFLLKFCNIVESITTIKSKYIYLFIISIIVIVIMNILKRLVLKISFRKKLDSREKYMYKRKQSAMNTAITLLILS